MDKRTKPLILAITVLFIIVFGVTYIFLDRNIELEHARNQQLFLEKDFRLLARLTIELQGKKSKIEIIEFLELNYGDHIVKSRNNDISIDGVILEFKEEMLIGVKSMALPS
ncbi:MAG: hypothetical protein KIT13_11195 [Burkholderiales bacterium]|nr:hypothetical protein [Burkholderiales bacterium]